MIDRLQKLIAHTGLMSRRGAEELIREGRVSIDGRVARLGDRADPAVAVVTIDGVPLPTKTGLVYVLLNKPEGVISTAHDPQGRATVVDLVPGEHRLYPVGRLDAGSSGLLLMTNDGTLANLVTHPRYEVEKTYVALVAGTPGRGVLRQLVAGVELDDGVARAVRARVISSHRDRSQLEVVMAEGRKREVRRMLDALGHEVHGLVRVGIGPVSDATLKPGSWRYLTVEEVRSLYAAAGATWQDAPTMMEQDE
ncbi:MAG: pseudouridine synthase [Acidimicrobiia bacterium]|jgi:pseudouridine synthase